MDLHGGHAKALSPDLAAPEAGETTAEEQAERERRRSFAGGITSHQWHPKSEQVLIVAHGSAFIVRIADGNVHAATPPGSRQTGIRLSPRGTYLSYVRDGDLVINQLYNGAERRLTTDGGGTVSNGLPEFIAQEEMHRFDGHWWSPDERMLAFTRVDTAPIPVSYRHEVLAGSIDVIPQRYPFAGAANAEVRLALTDINSGETRWLDWALADDDYLARVAFGPDGALYVQTQSRDQRRLTLRRWSDGHWSDVLTETRHDLGEPSRRSQVHGRGHAMDVRTRRHRPALCQQRRQRARRHP